MSYLILLLPIFIGGLVVGFGYVIESGPHSGGIITLIIVMLMMAKVVDNARSGGHLGSTLGKLTLLLLGINLAAFGLECLLNYILAPLLTETLEIDDNVVVIPTYLGMFIGYIYVIPRGFITWLACRIYKRMTQPGDMLPDAN